MATTPSVPSAGRLVAVLVALLSLLALSVALAAVDLGSYNFIVALLIAGAKMVLVMLFFMQLVHGTAAMRIAAGGGVFMLLILGVLMMSDYVGRNRVTARVLPVFGSEVPIGGPVPPLDPAVLLPVAGKRQ